MSTSNITAAKSDFKSNVRPLALIIQNTKQKIK